MAVEDRGRSKKRRGRGLIYFFLEKKLHKKLRITRPLDYIEAWHFEDHKRVGYVWSDVKRRMGKAYTTKQVAQMVNRHHINIEKYILAGHIRAPERGYPIAGGKSKGRYYWGDHNIIELHEYLLTVHRGRPRLDGGITPWNTPTRAELLAMLKHGTVLYTKTDEGLFVPVWKENDW